MTPVTSFACESGGCSVCDGWATSPICSDQPDSKCECKCHQSGDKKQASFTEKQKCDKEREDGSPCDGYVPCPRHFREKLAQCPGCDSTIHPGDCETRG